MPSNRQDQITPSTKASIFPLKDKMIISYIFLLQNADSRNETPRIPS